MNGLHLLTNAYPPEIKNQIAELLRDAIAATHVDIVDMSEQHARHAGARESGGGHYIVTVVSQRFSGLSLVARHRLVYKAVDKLRAQIHAMGITAHTPEEWAEL